ncbi:TIGR03826 family flagellar region protein [Peribacillus tepidiphilus]|uniref:TIGR03826 family flagellar region protein n=1 Tax=Peribacillus tepidiphilus TaxID=2652445 RepID=UPI001292384E|nr:TIGR03826 family flagellar region protein [Peribacillus tepidiphilus]
MGELTNCPKCDKLFVQTKFRDVCDTCFKEEEKIFEMVYKYIRKKENRTATMAQVVEDTGVDEELLIKFVKTGRLKLAQFPNLGYPCEKCGATIKEGKLCGSCAELLRSELSSFQKEEARKRELLERERKATYYTKDERD